MLDTLRAGARGAEVTILQLLLGVRADGVFGSATQSALKSFQSEEGLKPDGVCGESTWLSLIRKKAGYAPKREQIADFKQYDPRWGAKVYSSCGDKSQTMKSSGCGPTAMADIVCALWDKDVTPYELALKSVEWGTRTRSSGTSGTFFKRCAELYGCDSYLSASGMSALTDCLNAGGLAVVCFGPSKWTKGGHYCAVWDWDGEYFYINDPASADKNRAKGTYDEVKRARKRFYLFGARKETA
ncbi:MAG: peptidoglycan-binding protein [Clostridia bacterium]|nr:peptidoglycan-binding protein [Clostridia bacterium]